MDISFTKEELIQAIKKIDQNPTLLKGRQSSTYDLLFEGKKYPPILVLSVAYQEREGKELIRIWELERTTGVKYYMYKKKWYPEKEYHSILSIVHNQTIKKLLKEYPNQ